LRVIREERMGQEVWQTGADWETASLSLVNPSLRYLANLL
jgi:hypothetical protein